MGKAARWKPVKKKRRQRSPGRAISVREELWQIEAAVDGARILLDWCSADRQGEGATIVRDAARAAEAVLSLVGARVKLLGQVIGGEGDQALLAGRHTLVEPGEGDEGADIHVKMRPDP